MSKYSIIVPAHNAAKYIRKCLDSIRSQSLDDYELIVVCDSCEDDTWKVAAEYANIVIQTDHRNDGLARQAGLDHASGEWVLFLDDDDWWLHDQTLTIINRALSDQIDVLCFGFIVPERGVFEKLHGYAPVNRNGLMWPAVWNKCYRREFIKDLPFHKVRVTKTEASDIEWTRRLLMLEPRIGTLEMPLYYYDYGRIGSQTDRFVLGDEEDTR